MAGYETTPAALAEYETSQANRRALITPGIDVLMIGGASILFLLLAYYAIDKQASIHTVSYFAYYLSFLINFPHFLISYQFLYYDNRKRLLREKKMFWAAFIVPTVLVAFYVYAIVAGNKTFLGYSVEAMFMLVGWHYVKQIYGTIIITSAISEVYYSATEKFDLRFNMYTLWIFAWLVSQSGFMQNMFGVDYKTFYIPQWCKTTCAVILAISVISVLLHGIRKYVVEGKVPPMVSIVSFLSIYAWFIPTFYHPVFFYMIPFFHSLQYMLFAIALRKNKVRIENKSLHGKEYRIKYLTQFVGYVLLSVVLGAAFFYAIPGLLDILFKPHNGQLGPQTFMLAFTVFINIHHYFIDNAIWTHTNKDIGEYLIRGR